MNVSRSISYSPKSSTCPLRGSGNCREECPCPRQSMVATAKPRRRRSLIVSKYFSMNSPRPPKTQTVPLPVAESQRAKRNSTPSGVPTLPSIAPSGTGLPGMEMSVMPPRRLSSNSLFRLANLGRRLAQAQPHAAERQRAADQMNDGRRLAEEDDRQRRTDHGPEIHAERRCDRAERRAEIRIRGIGKEARHEAGKEIDLRRLEAQHRGWIEPSL